MDLVRGMVVVRVIRPVVYRNKVMGDRAVAGYREFSLQMPSAFAARS